MFSVRSSANPLVTPPRSARAFATTHWSMVLNAADGSSTESREALEELCRIYWPAVYGFARRRGMPPPDAEDLTQGFFADLLARGAIAQADAARGRFRSFLLASFQNYASHVRAHDGSHKRGGGCEIVSLEALADAEGHWCDEPGTTETPEKYFDRQWAMSLLHRALAVVQREYTEATKGRLFEEVKTAVWGGRGVLNYAAIAARLGTTEGALKVAVHRLRGRFGEQLRREVANTVAQESEVEDEVQHLLAAFAE